MKGKLLTFFYTAKSVAMFEEDKDTHVLASHAHVLASHAHINEWDKKSPVVEPTSQYSW